MSLLLYVFMLSGAVFHALSNTEGKKLLNKGISEDFVAVVSMAAAALVGFGGSFIMRGAPKIQPGFWVPFVAAALLNVFWWKLNIKAMKIEDISRVAPLASASPVSVVFLSAFTLGQLPTFWGGVGIGAVVVGTYAINLDLRGKPVELPKPLQRLFPAAWHGLISRLTGPLALAVSSRGARYALVAWGVFGAAATVITRAVVFHSDPLFRTGATFAFVAVCLYLDSLRRGAWRNVPKDFGMFVRVLPVGIAVGMADALYNFGYYYGIVPYLGALKQVQALLTVCIAWFFLGEEHFLQRMFGAILMLAGVALLAF